MFRCLLYTTCFPTNFKCFYTSLVFQRISYVFRRRLFSNEFQIFLYLTCFPTSFRCLYITFLPNVLNVFMSSTRAFDQGEHDSFRGNFQLFIPHKINYCGEKKAARRRRANKVSMSNALDRAAHTRLRYITCAKNNDIDTNRAGERCTTADPFTCPDRDVLLSLLIAYHLSDEWRNVWLALRASSRRVSQ